MSKPREVCPPDGKCRRCDAEILKPEGWAVVSVQPRELDRERYNLCSECTYKLLSWLSLPRPVLFPRAARPSARSV
jgi:DNA-directed RNA polymerase subunit RPC12/RpoP